MALRLTDTGCHFHLNHFTATVSCLLFRAPLSLSLTRRWFPRTTVLTSPYSSILLCCYSEYPHPVTKQQTLATLTNITDDVLKFNSTSLAFSDKMPSKVTLYCIHITLPVIFHFSSFLEPPLYKHIISFNGCVITMCL